MSRVGKKPILIPVGVKVELQDRSVKVTGPKGNLERCIPERIEVKQDGSNLIVTRADDERISRSLHGLTRSLINNMIVGVSEGFKKELDIIGMGYRAQMRGKDILSLSLGYSHPIEFSIPEGIIATVESGKGVNKIKLESYDKQLLGEIAAQIRKLRSPEPYKGKGIRYSDEIVKKKVGKAVVGK